VKGSENKTWSQTRGIVFDMDGVLLLSSTIHDESYREVLKPYGIRNFVYSRFSGMRTRDCLGMILRENQIPVADFELRALAAAKSKLALARCKAENPIAPDCVRVLGALATGRGLILASSGSEASVNWFIDSNGLRPLFRGLLHGEEVIHAKPSPEIFERACALLDLPAAQCMVVEDAVAGIQAAKSAGAIACGISTTRSESDLLEAGADFIIRRLSDLLELAPL
jgi:beta-phosphoglucomutase